MSDQQTTPSNAPEQPPNQKAGLPHVSYYNIPTPPQAAWAPSLNPYYGKSIQEQNELANRRSVPDVDPSKKVLATMLGQPNWPPAAPFEPNGDMLTRILDLEHNCCGILYSLNNASISATCNTDNTITITLNLPSLPAAC